MFQQNKEGWILGILRFTKMCSNGAPELVQTIDAPGEPTGGEKRRVGWSMFSRFFSWVNNGDGEQSSFIGLINSG